MPEPPRPGRVLGLTLGTAGHIDHGKTSLVRALVGGETDTDRLKEERDRGLTIDIGYAEWRLDDGTEVGIVDVPGHERFVRNMVAGATGMDVVLLVVAADDGAMPQTREHLQIMTLLGLRTGAVAITKIDLVEPDMRELVAEDVRALLRGTFLEGAALFPVSNATGEGIPALREGLSRLLRQATPRDAAGPFRMPVQRVFTSAGHGTVVTGIPLGGTVRREDRVELLPGGRLVRVRGVQAYHHDVAEASAGHRTALNLADVDYHTVRRGMVVAEPGLFRASTLLDVRFRCTAEGKKPLRHPVPVRMHVGTAEALGKLLLLEGNEAPPGEEAYAQILLEEPVVAAPGDRFLLRVPSPAATLGGGVVLGEALRRRLRRRPGTVEALREREQGLSDPRAALRSVLRAAGGQGADAAGLASAVRRRGPEVRALLEGLAAAREVVALRDGVHLHPAAWGRVRDGVRAALEAFHRAHPLRDAMRLAELRGEVDAAPGVVDAAVEGLAAEGAVEALPGGRARLAGRGATLSPRQAEALRRLEGVLREGGFATPREDEVPDLLGLGAEEAAGLLGLLVEQGQVLRLREGVILHAAAVAEGKRKVAERIRASGGIAPADLKDLLGATRKYGIPFLEHLDSTGFTVRVGDRRVLRERGV